MQFPIHIGLRRSRFLEAAVVSITLLTSGVTLALPWSTTARATSFLLVLIAGGLAWRRLGPTLSAIRLERAGQILVVVAGNAEFAEAELLAGATVHPWLTVVRLKTQDERTHLLITAVDSMKPEDFRRLRIFLRWQAVVSEEAGAP
ncbi:MAG TPA: hypothetical protein PLU47_10995 [Azonexus sp.]|nr:hypothetical protein [Azonexus sp.]